MRKKQKKKLGERKTKHIPQRTKLGCGLER
jgi:hypothetical protein